MTTLLEARDALMTALATAGLNPTDDPSGRAVPCTIVVGDGADTSAIGRRQLPAGFRVVLLAGAWDGSGTSRTLASSVSAFLTMAATLVGWGVGPMGPDRTYQTAGGLLLGAECTLSHQVDV